MLSASPPVQPPPGAQAAPIALLTDFGQEDWFVGLMRGVIAGIAPGRSVIDLCHQVPPGDCSAAGLMLEAALPYFPTGSVFCCVVDPGVGTERRILIAEVLRQPGDAVWLVAPDNGLVPAGIVEPAYQARYFAFDPDAHPDVVLKDRSATFHGRDIFAPLAAHLSLRCATQTQADSSKPEPGPKSKLGPALELATAIDDPVRLAGAEPVRIDSRGARGRVRYIDRFGNLVTDLRCAELAAAAPGGAAGRGNWRLSILQREIQGLSESYGERAPGTLLMYAGSMGYLEIAVNRGSAADELDCAAGAPIALQFADS